MADIDLKYPQKLGRFASNSCMKIYYSPPIGYGTFSVINDSGISDVSYKFIKLTIDVAYGWLPPKGIFSCGIFSGEIHTWNNNDKILVIKVNKDSFVTLDDYDNFINRHDGITYRFDVLRHYNGSDLKNAVTDKVIINRKKRINEYNTYSPYSFSYNNDFYYEIQTKTILLNDLEQIDDILRASSFVLKSNDTSVIRTGALDNLPDVIGIANATSNMVEQPYFGGVQNNEWYRATLIENEFVWDKGRYKGKLTFKVTG